MADVSQETALRKLRSTPVVRSKEPMAAEMRMEMIELVQTNVDKVGIFIFSSFVCLPPPIDISSLGDSIDRSIFFCFVLNDSTLTRFHPIPMFFLCCYDLHSFLESGSNAHVVLRRVLIVSLDKHGMFVLGKVLDLT